MDDAMVVGILALLCAAVGSRLISERSFKLLTVEEKGQMMDAFSNLRAFSVIPVVAMIGGYYLLEEVAKIKSMAVFLAYFALLLLYGVGLGVCVQVRLRSQFPKPEFLRLQFISQILRLIGMVVFIGTVIWTEVA